jgi:hypothetical protein
MLDNEQASPKVNKKHGDEKQHAAVMTAGEGTSHGREFWWKGEIHTFLLSAGTESDKALHTVGRPA